MNASAMPADRFWFKVLKGQGQGVERLILGTQRENMLKHAGDSRRANGASSAGTAPAAWPSPPDPAPCAMLPGNTAKIQPCWSR